MDNEQYLKQISAKPTHKSLSAKNTNKFFTPNMIKLFIGGAIAIVLLIVVINILGASAARAKVLTETLYTRLTSLSKQGGPTDKYGKLLSSSSLRALSGNLRTNLSNISRDLEGLLPELQIDRSKISSGVTKDEEAHLTDLNTVLEKARLNALLDRVYSREITLQIAQILSIESELYERTTNRALQDLLHRSTTNLRLLEIEFTDFTNNSR